MLLKVSCVECDIHTCSNISILGSYKIKKKDL
jgi:hypothetical protein